MKSTEHWTIGTDIEGSERLNGVSYQEDALITFGDYQYVTFYETTSKGYANHYVKVGRRRVDPDVGDWQYLTLSDYTQTTIDGHNMISMGISGDGKIHLSFDHHARRALELSFESLENGDLLLEFRIGQSGAGDSYIHRYSSSTGQWQAYGKYLEGSDNNAYINGLDYVDGRLYTTWTVRETPDANTNHGVFFAYSDDAGKTWFNTNGTELPSPISTAIDSTMIWEVPQNSRMVNQEGQLVDAKGRVHVLMRDNLSGEHLYQHYLRDSAGKWTKNPIQVDDLNGPDLFDPRGKLAGDKTGEHLFALLPDAVASETRIYASTAQEGFKNWKFLVSIPNTSTEPLFDRTRLREKDVLSVFVRQAGPYPDRKLQVWDFELDFE
ncbi:hypothetical protein FZEAL_5592 [Fusarium zealandicum]|uniref:Dockerin type 1 n=1 Tax=Fusarium zealandicum TaxID=1053134 RepID=A0A8H4UJD1_9HYPO|nr:hypothetical protein FZEAL_5592 [Fusarium zealandicum]